MDVDLLRPGTVPISPDTSLWFEFLLDPSHLEKHLKNTCADPPPTELIVKFLTLSLTEKQIEPGAETNGPQRLSKRCQALKILALQVAAYLKWDLELFENKLPLPLQATLLKDFLNLVSDEYGDVSVHNSIKFSEVKPQVLFAIFLYHRWMLRTFCNSTLNGKTKILNGLMPNENVCEEISDVNAERSYAVLKDMSQMAHDVCPIIPSMASFTLLTGDVNEVEHQWNLGKVISIDQFQCQLLMDLTKYLMFREIYSEAAKALDMCCTAFSKWKANEPEDDEPYSTVTAEMIAGQCLALGISKGTQHTPSLVQQFHKLVSQQYMSIEKILEKDNLTKEIPQLYRDCLELDITSEIAARKITVYRDALVQIQASNMVRRALEGGSWQAPKVTPIALQNALIPVIPRSSEVERNRLKYLVGTTLVNGDLSCRELVELETTKELLSEEEINSAVESDYTDPVPEILNMDLETSLSLASKHKSPSIRMAAIERTLTTSYDSTDIETAISKLTARNMNINMTKLNRNWEIPVSLSNAIVSLGGGNLQHYVFVLLAKAYELDKIENYSQAKALMRAAIDKISKEIPNQNATSKIIQLISWEILLVEIHEFHSEWPAKRLDWSGLGQKCIQVLIKIEGCLPRVTLREECALTLLNTGQWSALVATPQIKHSVALGDLYTAIAAACEDINKYNKKISTDAWDKILAMFATYNQKRRDVPPVIAQALCVIVELNALVIVISLLAKLHNVLIADQPQLELYAQLTQVWPNTIKNANQYNVKYVSEVLMEVLEHALKQAPNNVPWLKLKGDLHFANGHHSAALKSYIEAAIAGTDYFSRPLHKNIIEDHVYKRMIASCTALQCYTQAGILCQFLEDVDYTTAFKSLSEGCCNDSMDSYYDCIWDVNILEFLIHLHTKRGEHHRKQKVIRTIGLLELNSNNNDEIKREAENIRKGRFMRAMTAHYLS
ncbi:integrator complex subunit 8 [Cimex lectularius]|uniref:INTS8 TPR repeats domain-containing protein n=1 Tax=Cimex lectularius TaxID=79782 RepID=A0A8I6SSH5_CIMLE|nr:integrator complex subunit 8 [Cimex lectularius]